MNLNLKSGWRWVYSLLWLQLVCLRRVYGVYSLIVLIIFGCSWLSSDTAHPTTHVHFTGYFATAAASPTAGVGQTLVQLFDSPISFIASLALLRFLFAWKDGRGSILLISTWPEEGDVQSCLPNFVYVWRGGFQANAPNQLPQLYLCYQSQLLHLFI